MNISKLLSQQTLTNPAINSWGQPEGARTGALFFSFALRMWRTGITVGAVVVLLYFVWGAVEWLTSGNDSKGVDSAKKRFTNATIGLILMVFSFAIVAFLNELIFEGEFNIFHITIPGANTTTTP